MNHLLIGIGLAVVITWILKNEFATFIAIMLLIFAGIGGWDAVSKFLNDPGTTSYVSSHSINDAIADGQELLRGPDMTELLNKPIIELLP